MSYKSLLFCADEKTARLVTQVLSELDFTVEVAADTYATAKKLAEEHFDALVVDCQNEQDASVLFKAARNSAENHSSLSVAVVDGQAGVAKAFRIGANLVLTKPINVEQSKGTLRVARGLLKKNQAKPAAGAVSAPTNAPVSVSSEPVLPAAPAFSAPSSLPSVFTPVAPAAAAAHASAPEVPYSALQVDKDPEPAPEAADVAMLESLPHLPVARATEPISTPASLGKPFVVGPAAAAAAPAVEKKIVEHSAGSFAPLVTNEPIVREATAPSPFEMHAPVAPVPTFSTLDSRSREGGGAKGIFKTILAFGLLGVAFYLGWQKLPGLLQNHHLTWLHRTSQQPAPQKIETPAAQPTAAALTTAVPATAPAASDTTTPPAPSTTSAAEQIAATAAGAATTGPAAGNVEVQEMPIARDAKITVTPKPQALVVKNDDSRPLGRQISAPVAPSLSVANTGASSPIADLVTSNAPLPKPVPGTIRISQGVSQGLLMKKISPVYPPMAIQFRKEGTVEMLATIDIEGSISNVKVLSGDPMLARAAVDAVKQWEYRPYLLNGQPLAVETQISISFKMPR